MYSRPVVRCCVLIIVCITAYRASAAGTQDSGSITSSHHHPQSNQSDLLAALNPRLVWQRTSPNPQVMGGPVLYQIIFRSNATPGHIPVISPGFTLMDSPIVTGAGKVAIGGMSVDGSTGFITFANGQNFPGLVNSVTSGDGFISIGGTASNPAVALNTAATDARYLSSVTSGNGFISIGGTASNPTVALNTAATDARYLSLAGGTLTGALGGTSANFNGNISATGSLLAGLKLGIGTIVPTNTLSISGQTAQTIWMERNTDLNGAGRSLTLQAGGATSGAADQVGGDLLLASGVGTGQGGGGNLRLQAGPAGISGTSDDALVDRQIIIANAKPMNGGTTGSANLFFLAVASNAAAGGRVQFTIRATDGTNFAAESGEILFLASNNGITCKVAATTVNLGSGGAVTANCSPAFFNGSQPGISITDTVTGFTPTIHDVYFDIVNNSGSALTLLP